MFPAGPAAGRRMRGVCAEWGMPKKIIPKLAGLLILCLLALLPAVAPAGTGGPQSGLSLGKIKLTVADHPALGDTLEMEFTLTNQGPRTVDLDDANGAFVLAEVTPAGSRRTISRVLGKSYQGWRLKPGQSLVVSISQLLDMAGSWKLVPGYQAGAGRTLFEPAARTVKVGGAESGPGVSGGSGLIKLKVVSYNLALPPERQKKGLAELKEIMSSQSPDLVAMQEVTEKTARLAAWAAGLKHVAFVRAYGEDKWRVKRVALLSRWPLTATGVHLPGGTKPRTVLRAEVDIDGVPLVFWAVHLIREGLVDGHLKGIFNEVVGGGLRMEEMEALVAHIKHDRHRFIIVAGDMNTFPMSAPYRLLSDVLEDAFPDLISEGTYRLKMLSQSMSPAKAKLLESAPNPKIDHIFHSKALMADGAFVIKEGQSDHFPIGARLAAPLEAEKPGAAQIERAQAALGKDGLLGKAAAGKLDAPTRRAIAAFQRQKGLAIDGLLQGETLKMLSR